MSVIMPCHNRANDLQRVLEKLGVNVADVSIVSTNLKLNLSGLPRGDQGVPSDPGVAVYFQKKNGPMRVIATRLDISRASSAVVEVVFSVPPGMERILLLPSARPAPVPFRIGDRTVDDSAKRLVTV